MSEQPLHKHLPLTRAQIKNASTRTIAQIVVGGVLASNGYSSVTAGGHAACGRRKVRLPFTRISVTAGAGCRQSGKVLVALYEDCPAAG